MAASLRAAKRSSYDDLEQGIRTFNAENPGALPLQARDVFSILRTENMVKSQYWTAIEECVLLRQEYTLFEEWAVEEAKRWETITASLEDDPPARHFAVDRATRIKHTLAKIQDKKEFDMFFEGNQGTHFYMDYEEVKNTIFADIRQHVSWQET